LNVLDVRNHPAQKNERLQEAYTRQRERNRVASVKLVPLRAPTGSTKAQNAFDKNATFGQRRHAAEGMSMPEARSELSITHAPEGGMEMSWVPSPSAGLGQDDSESQNRKRRDKERRKGVEKFGAGLEKGGEDQSVEMTESSRKGRTQRRKDIRSGSKAAFRRMGI
jgi:ribosome biogenesis protein ENP2